MQSKKGTQKQKQKQRQKQTVIVNINEKPKTRRRRATTTTTLKRTNAQQQQHNPIFNPSIINNASKQHNNDNVRDMLFKLGKENQITNSLIQQAIANKKVNHQAEIIADTTEADVHLPNRPPSSISSHDAELLRLRSISSQQTPFSFSTAEAQTEDLQRVKDRLIAPSTPMNAYLEQVSEHHTPIINQPPPQIHIEAGTSGTDPIGELDYDAIVDRQPDAEVAKDTQEFFDYMKVIGIRPSHEEQGTLLRQQQRAPTLAEKAGFPVAESRFTSPEPPQAFAQPAVLKAESKKVNANTDSRLQLADFRNVSEAQEAIKTWNRHQDKSETIKLTRDGGGGYKNLGELQLELASRNMDFQKVKAFHESHTSVSPHIPMPRKVKQSKSQQPLGSPLG